jgi:hypothetical protein
MKSRYRPEYGASKCVIKTIACYEVSALLHRTGAAFTPCCLSHHESAEAAVEMERGCSFIKRNKLGSVSTAKHVEFSDRVRLCEGRSLIEVLPCASDQPLTRISATRPVALAEMTHVFSQYLQSDAFLP